MDISNTLAVAKLRMMAKGLYRNGNERAAQQLTSVVEDLIQEVKLMKCSEDGHNV